jgi:translation initiation factor IF-2
MVKKDETGSENKVRSEHEENRPASKAGHKPHADASIEQHAPVHPGEMSARAPDQTSGPTITMQGVSGKKITGVVKVVKAARPTTGAETETAAKAAPAEPAAEPEVSAAAARPEKPAESTPVRTPTGTASETEAPAQPAAAAAGESVKAAAQETTPAAATGTAQRAPAATPAETAAPTARATAPAPSQTPYGTPNRPQSGNYNRAPGSAPSQTPYGTPNRPQSGNYNRDRAAGPSGAGRAPGQTPYGTPNRPQSGNYNRGPAAGGSAGGRGPAGGGYNRDRGPGAGGRPQGGGGFDKDRAPTPAFGSRPAAPRPKPAVPAELAGKESTVRPRPAEPKRDERREPKKEALKTPGETRDKHNVLRQQAAVVSGKGIAEALSDDTVLDTLYTDSVKGRRGKTGGRRMAEAPAHAVLTQVSLPESLTVKEFAEAIKKTTGEVIKKLIRYGIMATVNQVIDFDTASLIADEFGIHCEKLVEVTEEDILFDDSEDREEDLKPRPPVVVVMGHVDHGKTSILDRIRQTHVASGEAGGITQHIGAYTVRVKGRQITFLDTPGHEAFTTMRARGAQVTDIAILVVAADDGVMPQTVEAINHAKAANTQIVVAINKIDKEGANIERVKQELAKYDLIPEEWGGSTVMVPVSAKLGTGIDELLDMVLLTADMLDLKANPDKQAKGTVIEAKLDKNRGPVATLLVQRGTLRTGDTLVTGSIIGNVRAMFDDKGNMVKKAGPSIPVEIIGLPEVPEAGEIFYAVTDDKVARALAEKRKIQQREKQLRGSSHVSLETLYSKMAAGEVKDLNIIVKADVQGSVEAVRQSLEKLSNDEVRVNVIHGAVGAITESDIRLAEVSNAIVIGFNVRPAANVADLANEANVDVRLYRVIYNAIEDVEAAMKGMLAPKFKENVLGHAEVRQVFKVSGVGTVAGCYVTDGKIPRSAEVRIVRDGIVVHEGKLASLKRFKDDVREVAAGYECGIGIERFNDIKEGDVFEAFEMQEIERS